MNNTPTPAPFAETSVSPESLPAVTHQDVRVVTTELLAQLYGATPKRISDNYLNNAARFELGKHYYKLTGAELKAFKNKPDSIGLVEKNARHLILWTGRGAARHAKILDTEQAWEIFERLEDCYFGIQESPARQELPHPNYRPDTARVAHPAGLTLDQQDSLKALIRSRVEALPRNTWTLNAQKLWSALKTKFGVSYKDIPATEFAAALSLAARLPLAGGGQTRLPLSEPAPLPPELAAHIARKANALSVEGYERIRARLEQRARELLQHYPHAYVRDWIDRHGSADAELVVIHADDLWHITAQIKVAHAGTTAALGAVHELERITGRDWYGKPAVN